MNRTFVATLIAVQWAILSCGENQAPTANNASSPEVSRERVDGRPVPAGWTRHYNVLPDDFDISLPASFELDENVLRSRFIDGNRQLHYQTSTWPPEDWTFREIVAVELRLLRDKFPDAEMILIHENRRRQEAFYVVRNEEAYVGLIVLHRAGCSFQLEFSPRSQFELKDVISIMESISWNKKER